MTRLVHDMAQQEFTLGKVQSCHGLTIASCDADWTCMTYWLGWSGKPTPGEANIFEEAARSVAQSVVHVIATS